MLDNELVDNLEFAVVVELVVWSVFCLVVWLDAL